MKTWVWIVIAIVVVVVIVAIVVPLVLLLGKGSSSSSKNPIPPIPPSPPPFKTGYLSFVIENKSGYNDQEVFILVTGTNEDTNIQSFLLFDSQGIGQLVEATPGENAQTYSLPLTELPSTNSNRVLYLPQFIGGLVWISFQKKLSMEVNAPHSIVQPNFLNPDDPNYNTIYDIFEITFTKNSVPNIAADATAVSFFSIPIVGYISTPSSKNSFSGLYQDRKTIFSSVKTDFNNAPTSAQWKKLIQTTSGGVDLRIVSTGKGMSANLFDANYLNNSASYGFSYLADVWTGFSSFYRSNDLIMTIPEGSGATYKGQIQDANSILFTSDPGGYIVIFQQPTNIDPTTSFNIFSGSSLVAVDTSPDRQDGVQLSKLFEEAIVTGLVPTADPLSEPFLLSNRSKYYTFNSNLKTNNGTGPWYDLYSKSLHSLGDIYTFAYDDALHPDVQIFSNSLQENKTYMSITIENSQ